MIVSKAYEIDSCDDVELGIKRESKLEFKLWYDDKKHLKPWCLWCKVWVMIYHRSNMLVIIW